MAVPTDLTGLSTTGASNSPSGSDPVGTDLDNFLRIIQAMLKEAGATLYTASGTNTITFNTTPTFSAYATGQRFWIKAAGANTGAVTVNANSLGAKSVVKDGATALVASDIPAANAVLEIVYDGTNFLAVNVRTPTFGAGTVSLPAITLNGDTDSGLYQIGANNLGFAVSGAKVLDIASTGLSVTGTLSSTGDYKIAGTGIYNATATNTSLGLFADTNAYAGIQAYGSSHATKANVTELLAGTGVIVGTFSSTGLAVTGVISATGTSSLARIDQSNGSIDFASLGNGSTSWQIGTQTALKPLDIFIGGAVIAQFSDTGLAVTGATSTTTGMAVGGATAGAGGIAFPATAVAVADVNTLDDYEEGTWTPSQGSGLTLVGAFSSTGKYTKIGNVVTVTGTVSGATSVACASAALLTENLPFQASITGRGTGVAVKSGLDGACFFITGTNGISTFTAIAACPTIFFSATYLV